MNRPVSELDLPPDCLLIRVQRGETIIVPHGDTVLQAGDIVEIFGLEDELNLAQNCLIGATSDHG